MVAAAEKWGHNMEKQEVHKLSGHYRWVHSSIGLYSPSYTYLGLDFSPWVADLAMEGSCNPSWTCMQYSK